MRPMRRGVGSGPVQIQLLLSGVPAAARARTNASTSAASGTGGATRPRPDGVMPAAASSSRHPAKLRRTAVAIAR